MKSFSLLLCTLLLFNNLLAEDLAKPIELNLASTLRLVDERNTDLAIALETIQQAEIASKEAWYQWLPNLRAGFAYAEQKGPLQRTDGHISYVERTADSSGLGVAFTGAGLAAQPGISLEVNLVDAIYDPKLAKLNEKIANADKEETRFLTMMDAVERYFHYVLSTKSVALHEQALQQATALAETTGEFANVGQGLEADADRAAVEQSLRKYRLENARFKQIATSAELASLLKFPTYQTLKLHKDALVPLTLYPEAPNVQESIQLALDNRPAIEAVAARLEASQLGTVRTQRAPFIPKLGAGYSYGQFGDQGDFTSGNYDEREETFVYLYWQLDNLGLGNDAMIKRNQSKARQLKLEMEQVEVNMAIRIQTAIAELETTRSQLTILEKGVARARNGFELSRKRIFENQGLPLEALDAFKSLAEIELLYAKTIAKFNTSQLFLMGATGKELSVAANP